MIDRRPENDDDDDAVTPPDLVRCPKPRRQVIAPRLPYTRRPPLFDALRDPARAVREVGRIREKTGKPEGEGAQP